MTCGSGGIGNASIATLPKDLRQRLAGDDETDAHWKLDPKDYTMEFVSLRVSQFFSEKAKEADFKLQTLSAAARLRLFQWTPATGSVAGRIQRGKVLRPIPCPVGR
jgi:hypothetical protein